MKHRASSPLLVLVLAFVLAAVPAMASGESPADAGDAALVTAGDGHDVYPEFDAGADHDHDQQEAAIAREADRLRELNASGVTSPFFNESGGCGPSSGVATPMTTSNASGRTIPSGHEVRGPYGDFYGRNYTDVNGSQVWWTVPMSGGARVRVHERALPAFQQVAANLNAEAARGNYYQARILGSYTWRRIGGSYRMSNHAFGTAIDINWDRNPYSGSDENVLITDMPDWYVKAWTDAGFCWGGDWVTIKDPMHFSWMGPVATDGYGTVPAPFPPTTVRSGYEETVFAGPSAFGSLRARYTYGFADGNRDSAPDLFRIQSWGADDVLLEFARSSRDFQSCGVTALRARGMQNSGDRYLLADHDGDSRTDLWSIEESGQRVVLRIATHAAGYREALRIDTAVPVASDTEYAAADYDRDGIPDLYVIRRPRGQKVRVEVWSGASDYATLLLDAVTRINGDIDRRLRIGVGDRNVDGIPDVYAVRVFATVAMVILDGATGYSSAPERLQPGVTADRRGVYGLGDYDGDGRTDLLAVGRDGTVEVALGGVQPKSADFWFRPADWACTDTVTSADPWDYNGDRIADLTVGAPGEDLSARADAGVVHVVDGTAAGPTHADLWYQDRLVTSPSEPDDGFGTSAAWGDFNDDGYADLLVGVPREDLGSVADAGLVNVVYGSDDGLDPHQEDFENQVWHRDLAAIAGAAAAGDHLGAVLAVGDFDDDDFDDVAIAAPHRAVGGVVAAGEVLVIYGSKKGLDAGRHQLWSASSDGVPGAAGGRDGFGSALAAGDFNRDGYADLAIGVPSADHPQAPESGAVVVLYGGDGGLLPSAAGRFTLGAASAGGTPSTGDAFGAALAAGDFDGDGMDDLAVGASGDQVGSVAGAGAVYVLFGASAGLGTTNAQVWHLHADGLNGAPASGDRFGSVLAAGDFDDNGFADLAIGVPGSTAAGNAEAGVVMVLRGRRGGLTGSGSQRWHDDKIGGGVQPGARFGTSLAVGDYDGDLVDDLVIGSPLRDVSGIVDAGRVALLHGRSVRGLGRARAKHWSQGAAVGGTAEAGDGFGILVR